MEEVQRNVHFVRSRYSNQSTKYSEEKMLENIKEYLQKNRYITTRIMRIHFGLTPYMAQKWLTHFCEKGIMVKEGTQHAPIYFLK
jgi:ribosomal protein S25